VGGQQLPSHSANATTEEALQSRMNAFQHRSPLAASRLPFESDGPPLRKAYGTASWQTPADEALPDQ
jgi:hypothetical protein